MNERETEGRRRTKRLLVFDKTEDSTRSATRTSKDAGKPDEGIIDIVKEELNRR